MNDTCFLVLAAGRREATLGIALRLRCLLLLLDSGYLDSTCGHGHSRRDRCEDIADYGHLRRRAVGVQGVGGRLRHGLYHLHCELLARCIGLNLGYLLFLVFLGFLDLVGVALGKLNLAVVLLFSLCDFKVGLGLHILRHLLHTCGHNSEHRLGESGKARGPVAAVFLGGIKEILPRLVNVEKLVCLRRAELADGIERLLIVCPLDALLCVLVLLLVKYALVVERLHHIEVALHRHSLTVGRSFGRLCRLRQVFPGILLLQVALRLQILLVGDKPPVVCFEQQVHFEGIALPGLAVFILLAPFGHTLGEQFLTAQLLRSLGLFNLHLVAVPFLRSLVVGGLHLFEVFDAYIEKPLLQGFLLLVQLTAGRVKIHLRVRFLGLLHTLCLVDFEGCVAFEPSGLHFLFLFEQFLIVLVLGEVEAFIDSLAVFVILDFEIVFVEKELRPRLQPCGIVGDILRRSRLPVALGVIEGIAEVLTGFDLRPALGGFPRFPVFLRLVGCEVVEVEVGITAHDLRRRAFEHRQPGACLVEEVAQLCCRHIAHRGVRLVQSENYAPSAVGIDIRLVVTDKAAQFRLGICGERIAVAFYILDFLHSDIILGLPGYHFIHNVHRVRRHTFLLPGVALDCLQLVHKVLRERARGLQLIHHLICDADGVAQGFALVDKRLLQLLRPFLERVAVSFVGGFTGNLYRPLPGGDTCSGGEAFVRLGKVRDFSALVDKPFEIFAVLLDDFVLDLLVCLCAFLGRFEPPHERVYGLHFLVQLLREIGGGVPGLAHLLCIFRSAVAQRLDCDCDSGEHRKDQPERVGLYHGVEYAHGVCGRAHALRESDNGDAPEDNCRAVCHHSGLADSDNGVPRHGGRLDKHNPPVIGGDDGNDIGDSLAVCDDERHKGVEHTEEHRR